MRQFERAVETEDKPALRACRSGEMLVFLYPKNRQKLLQARSYFIEAVRLQPRLAERNNGWIGSIGGLGRLPDIGCAFRSMKPRHWKLSTRTFTFTPNNGLPVPALAPRAPAALPSAMLA